MSLKVKTEQIRDGVITISLIGSIDKSTYPDFEAAADSVLNQNPIVIIFDMEYVDYINSMGARALLSSNKKMRRQNCEVLFLRIQPQIRKVFDILDTLPLMRIFDNPAELDDYLDSLLNLPG
jgi:anti-anti-sigma factor